MDNQEKLLNEYVESLMAERGISDDVPQEVRERMKKDVLERLNNFFISRVIESVPAEKIDEIDKIIQAGDSEKTWQYIHSNVPNFDKLSFDVLADFRSKYLA